MGKVLLTPSTICSLCFMTIFNSIISRFGFEGGIWILIYQVPGHCKRINYRGFGREGSVDVISWFLFGGVSSYSLVLKIKFNKFCIHINIA